MRRTVRELRADQGPDRIWLRNLVRRVLVKATGKLWQLAGYPGEVLSDIPRIAEVGFVSRPRAGKGEAIVLKVGEKGHRVIIATRDGEIELDIDEDETAIFNSQVRVICKNDGTVHIDNGSGAEALATKADLQAVVDWLETHIHPDPSSGNTGTPTTTPPSPDGTTVLMGK